MPMNSNAAIHSAEPKWITIGVIKLRTPESRTTLAFDASAITTKARPVRPAAEDPTIR